MSFATWRMVVELQMSIVHLALNVHRRHDSRSSQTTRILNNIYTYDHNPWQSVRHGQDHLMCSVRSGPPELSALCSNRIFPSFTLVLVMMWYLVTHACFQMTYPSGLGIIWDFQLAAHAGGRRLHRCPLIGWRSPEDLLTALAFRPLTQSDTTTSDTEIWLSFGSAGHVAGIDCDETTRGPKVYFYSDRPPEALQEGWLALPVGVFSPIWGGHKALRNSENTFSYFKVQNSTVHHYAISGHNKAPTPACSKCQFFMTEIKT
ncbi:hypothetical protein CEXT_662431 [Caerostris extrusa]|uniref:Uncharacterized protein n=1 Tax=Caerostris extrusa TaxID=172846 RepID=A0AAV4TS10_CAEEX|nr:hypothetical protein CEXT_662431 [Caerostris extrusa]